MPGWWVSYYQKCHSFVYLCAPSFFVVVFSRPIHNTVEQWLRAAGLHITTEDHTSSNIARLAVQGCMGGRHPVIIPGHKEVWQEAE